MSHIESVHGDSTAGQVVQCCQAEANGIAIQPDHQTLKQSMKQPGANKWLKAKELELMKLGRLSLFSTPVMLPEGATEVGICLIFKEKIERNKACLVAQGFFNTLVLISSIHMLKLRV